MKITKEQYDRAITRIERLEKAINGGKGSGNFGHSGRPGKVGGSGSSGSIEGMATSELEKAAKEYREQTERYKTGDKRRRQTRQDILFAEAMATRMETELKRRRGDQEVATKKKDKGFQSEYKVGDTYEKGGVTYDVVEGKNGPMAVSRDGKINTTLPDQLRHDQTKMIEDTFDGMRDEGVPMDSPRYQAARDTYKRIQERAIETSRKGLDASNAPKMVREEVDRFLKQIETMGPSKSVESYHKTATGILEGWATGNGGLNKPVSSQTKQEVKELKAELDSLYERYRIMTTPKGFREK